MTAQQTAAGEAEAAPRAVPLDSLRGDCAQPPFCAIAYHRVADLAACRKTDPDTRAARILSRLRRGLHNKGRPHGSAASGGNTEKIGAVLEPCKVGCHASRRSRQLRAGP